MFGYQSPALANCKPGLNVKPIAEGVRFTELLEPGTCRKISSRFEMFDKKWNKWFEAEKVGETYKLTAKGKSDREARIDNCTGSCNRDWDCPDD